MDRRSQRSTVADNSAAAIIIVTAALNLLRDLPGRVVRGWEASAGGCCGRGASAEGARGSAPRLGEGHDGLPAPRVVAFVDLLRSSSEFCGILVELCGRTDSALNAFYHLLKVPQKPSGIALVDGELLLELSEMREGRGGRRQFDVDDVLPELLESLELCGGRQSLGVLWFEGGGRRLQRRRLRQRRRGQRLGLASSLLLLYAAVRGVCIRDRASDESRSRQVQGGRVSRFRGS